MSKLEDVEKQLNKTFGSNTVLAPNQEHMLSLPMLQTGSIALDRALGGGLLVGRVGELMGSESCGKTSLALHMTVEAQKISNVLFVDMEHALDFRYAKNIGVDFDKWRITQPDCAEDAFEIIEAVAACEDISLIVLDSVAALSPRAEIEGNAGESNMGLLPRFLGQHLRKVIPLAAKYKTCILYVNQLRTQMSGYGNPNITPGGKALKYFSSFRLDIRRIKTLAGKEGDKEAIRSCVKVVKNKYYIPFKEAEFNIIFGKGIDQYEDLISVCVSLGIIKKSGSWYSYGEQKLGQGVIGAAQFIKDENLFNDLKEKIYVTK